MNTPKYILMYYMSKQIHSSVNVMIILQNDHPADILQSAVKSIIQK